MRVAKGVFPRGVAAGGLLFWILLLTTGSIAVFLYGFQVWMDGFRQQVDIQRRQNLIQVVSIARNAVEPTLSELRNNRITREAARERVRALVRTMTYEDQYGRNYVFMSAYDGTMLVQPFEPELEMTSQWDLRDDNGVYIIRELARAAQNYPSGSFLQYHYHLPGVFNTQEKLAYVVGLPEIGCYIGAGMYMQKAILEQTAIFHKMRYGALGLAGVVLLTAAVAISVIVQRSRQLTVEVETRRRAEQALSLREANYRELVENARTVILRWDTDGRILYLNEFGEQLLGWTNDEIAGRNVMETIVPPRETTGRDMAEMIHDLLRDPDSFSTNINENISRDGRRFWILWKNRPILDDRGNLREVLSVGSDITSLREAEESLRETERLLAAGARAARLGIWGWDARADRFTLSEEWRHILGDAPLPRTLDELSAMTHPDDRADVLRAFDRTLSGEKSYEIEHRLVRPDGEVRTVRVCGDVVRDGEDRAIRIYGAALDITDRKRVEDALDSQLRLMNTLLDNLPIGVFMVEAPGGRPLVANDRARELLGRGILPDVNRENLAEVYEAWRYGAGERYPVEKMPVTRGMYGEKSRVDDMEVVRPDGSRVLLEVSGCPVRDAGGNVKASLVSFMDITERKRTEKALLLNTDRLETLIQLNQMGEHPLEEISDFTLERAVRLTGSSVGYLAFVNEAGTEMTMYSWSRNAMRDCNVADRQVRYPVAGTGLWGEAIRQRKPVVTNDYAAPNPWKKGLPAGHVPITRHMNVPVFSGERIVLVAGVGNKEEEYTEDDVRQLTLLMEGMWNLVERNQAADAIRERERHLNLITNSVPAIIAHMGADRRFLLVNRAYSDFFCHPPENIIGRHLREIIGDDAYIFSIPYVERVLSGEAVEFEDRVLDGLGRERDIILNYVPDFDSGGSVTGFFTLVQDITDRKRAEAERLEMERALLHSQKLESLGVLAGGIAHDFNNLLAAILGNLELALLDMPQGSAARPETEEAVRITRRAADLTRQMLAYSGRGLFVVRPLDLASLVRENIGMLRAAVSRTVSLHAPESEGLPPILADAGQVQQVVMNLIINASEAIGDRDGVVSLSFRVRECDIADLALSRLEEKPDPGRFVELEVSDTGCGMDYYTIARLFDPFFTTKFTGRGLGMSAVLGIVRGHGGAITVESLPGRGTTVRVLFPVAPDSSEMAAAAQPGRTAGPALHLPGAVLVADDEEHVRATTVRILKRLGLRVLEAGDGREAVERFRENAGDISLVLLDLTMPRLDGAGAYAEIARIRPDAPVILLSGYSEQEVRARFTGGSLAGFVEKPFSLQTLFAEIERTVNRRKDSHAG